MILNAVLLTLGRIVHDSDIQPNLDVAILLELSVAYGDGIHVKNPISGYKLLLTGTIDCGVVKYKDEHEAKHMYAVISCNL